VYIKEYLLYVNNLLIYATKIVPQNWEFMWSDLGKLALLSHFFLVAQDLIYCRCFLILLSRRSCAGVECNRLPLTLQSGVANEQAVLQNRDVRSFFLEETGSELLALSCREKGKPGKDLQESCLS